MINFDKVLSNPWVWGVGVVLGVLVLSSASRGSAPAGEPSNPYGVTYGGAQASAFNAAAFEYSARMAETAAATARSNSANNLARDLKVIDAIQSSEGIWATVQAAQTESAAGVAKARIEANTAVMVDRAANETRRDMIYVTGQTSNFAAQLAAQVEREKTAASLKATTQANKINGDNSFWSGVFDFVGNVGKVLIPFLF